MKKMRISSLPFRMHLGNWQQPLVWDDYYDDDKEDTDDDGLLFSFYSIWNSSLACGFCCNWSVSSRIQYMRWISRNRSSSSYSYSAYFFSTSSFNSPFLTLVFCECYTCLWRSNYTYGYFTCSLFSLWFIQLSEWATTTTTTMPNKWTQLNENVCESNRLCLNV